MTKTHLTLGMALLFLVSFVLLGLIVVNEKKVEIMMPQVDQKFRRYLQENYEKEVHDFNIGKIHYNSKKKRFEMKISNQKNSHLFFTLFYKHQHITSTYSNDYKKGATLLRYYEKKLSKKLGLTDATVQINSSFAHFSPEVKDALLQNKDIETLKIYTISYRGMVSSFQKEDIFSSISTFYQNVFERGFTPKNYTITLTNQQDITQAVTIQKLVLPTDFLDLILTGILADDKSIEKKYNITYRYLN